MPHLRGGVKKKEYIGVKNARTTPYGGQMSTMVGFVGLRKYFLLLPLHQSFLMFKVI